MSPALTRLISLGAYGAVIAAALFALIAGATGWMQAGAALEAAEARAAAPAPRINADRYLIAGAGRPNAESALQGRISAHARPAGVDVNRIRIVPENNETPDRLTAEISVSGRWAELTRFIHLLESEPPALVISEMRMVADVARPRRDLEMTLTVEARFLPEDGR